MKPENDVIINVSHRFNWYTALQNMMAENNVSNALQISSTLLAGLIKLPGDYLPIDLYSIIFFCHIEVQKLSSHCCPVLA